MPAGVGWGEYLRTATVVLLTMAAGSQTVHYWYRPLDGLEHLVKEKEQVLIEQRTRILSPKLVDNKSTTPPSSGSVEAKQTEK